MGTRHFLPMLGLMFSIMLPNVALAMLKLPSIDARPALEKPSDESFGKREHDIGIKPGTTVPKFAINNHQGQLTSLEQLLNKGPLLVIFYRGGWCPYCNLQIRSLTEIADQFQRRGITPVLISADKVEGATLALKTYDIPFPVLSDPSLKAHEAFEVILSIDAETYKKYLTYGIDLEKWSGQDHHKIAVASAFIVNEKGVVQWAHTSMNYRARPSNEQLLKAIDEWQTRQGKSQ